ncbi:putative tRNA-dihydrouridine synthase [Aquimixticola soesokkakensis]|uniref:tRNA-dihydrouridine(20/20a) synthase n=1 Tax=Aquimixticola soesokkakensis TaxID=1519096 RepID=A0A1Y5T3U3_9RHOB|nr:tRNA dihydrouridine(20/20a) synthase DusA [Aquimixticola soesokkakensis]SLN55177.1 putative tRNA-dihydrouridine synthase [Aquimixticola soesokkakensis]
MPVSPRPLQTAARLSVAPMMDWTDRHCRYFHRLMSRETLLYTEMVTAPALVRGGALHLLDHSPEEHPLALQLGGSDPQELGKAAALGAAAGYDEINLNVGCPSDRVQSGCFGAVLMKSPDLVADCLHAMQDASSVEVTVKCRIGVDDQDPAQVLPAFLEQLSRAGVRRVQIHARKAWLQGLSPKENRDIPPLDFDLVQQMTQSFPDLHLSINGGIKTLDEAEAQLAAGLDGVMVGRAAYHQPWDILGTADARIYGAAQPPKTRTQIVHEMEPYITAHLAAGGKLAQITRHMLGLFAGAPGARAWRRVLSDNAHRRDVDFTLLVAALAARDAAAPAGAPSPNARV